MFSLSRLLRRRLRSGYPADLPERILAALEEKHVTRQDLRRRLFGLERLDPDQAAAFDAALRDLEAAGRVRRFGRGHGSTFYEHTFYAAVTADGEAW